MIRQVLLATDFSRAAQAAVPVAVEQARRFGARLHLLTVVWPAADPAPDPRLAGLAGELQGSGVPIVTAVESGIPAAEIVRYARRNGIDLIVIGTHGRTGFTRALVGSVAERVVRTAPCAVLTVPPAEARQEPEVADPRVEARRCLVCAGPTEDLICEPCRVRIRGQVMEARQREERSGRI
jgi:nucleotide-binding universal stress UspA family protein